ncbi:MAG: glycosyl hydrolase [Leptolyngbyaceae bacterium]|nr:glycosyl hydrolase [Leptolyngbyaceae bacterium]
MVRKVWILAIATFLIVSAVGFLFQPSAHDFISANILSDHSVAFQNKQLVLETFDIAQRRQKTISGLYAGDERMFKPHWWEESPPGDTTFDQFVRHVQDRTGERVGIVEVRFTSYQDDHEYGDLDRIVDLMDEQIWQQGSIPSVSDFMPNPWNGGDGRNRDVGRFEELFTPGTRPYARFHQELDFLAEGLHKLQERGIPVLLRLFHENTGGWFWWGRRTLTPEHYQQLWRYTFDYFETDQELDNLIWVYGPSTSHYDLIPATYPGDDYVHIVGISNYGCNPGRADVIESYRTLRDTAPDKPFAFTEIGPDRDGQCRDSYNERLLQTLDTTLPEVVYFVNWFGPRAALALYPNADTILQHPKIWNADDLREVGRSPN